MRPNESVKLGNVVGIFPEVFIQVRLENIKHVNYQRQPIINIIMVCDTVFNSKGFEYSTHLNLSVNAYVYWETSEADIMKTCINLFENLKNLKYYANYSN